MKNKRIQSNILLLAASLIWGFAFVAQRRGMDFTGPLTFNGIRFLLGALTLLPFMLLFKPSISFSLSKKPNAPFAWHHGWIGALCGIKFSAGWHYLYLCRKSRFYHQSVYPFVPAFGLLRRQSSGPKVWAGAIIATIGLYLLSVHENMQMDMGDLLVLISAVFWAMHMIVLSYIAPLHDFRVLAFIQFFVSGFISLVLAFIFESPDFNQLNNAALPILYAGIASAELALPYRLLVSDMREPIMPH
jgi:drug/metabolite transporter (DMT)-like permease